MAKGGDFSQRINGRADNLLRNTERRVKRAAMLIDQTLVTSTPVDTGRARSNWLAGIGAAPSGTVAATSASAAIAAARSAIDQYKLGSTIFIANNVSYISKLNSGSSAQAPAGFVEKAVARGRRSLGQRGVLDRDDPALKEE